jgi:hypothetical protein
MKLPLVTDSSGVDGDRNWVPQRAARTGVPIRVLGAAVTLGVQRQAPGRVAAG